MEIIKPGGFQDQLLSSGDLRINPKTNRWEGLVRGKYQYVRPTEYIKMRLAQSKGADAILPGKGVEGSTDYYPYHGTTNKDIKYLTRPSEVPGSSGYFTIINDGNTGSGNVRAKYQGTGYSIPFFMKEHVDVYPLKNVGNSNSVHGTGKSLRTTVEENPGKIIDARGVVDGTYGGYNHEYNFGPGVKDVKSMINTLDFEPGAGPFAYSQNMSDERNFT